ncbi:c-type cytochrome [Paracraurococcus lichenis]|uniref:Cytochrome c n=1 Tax=Paracraurococcus lichenis TaxID=3064888 RepID=A0ABT9E410_9PROT|nr:cytochrome c [Paracraurococcus sp. LOR1-02]MDO9710904.1 cytochrome c [Paracraurococcus sp. LOR1-02]
MRYSWLALACALAAGPAPAQQRLGIGTPASPEAIAGWDIDVAPDGTGLPEGRGSVAEGAALFAERCASCHGPRGQEGALLPALRLAGGEGSLASSRPVQTVGSYWPYATTLFDYTRRAMPFNAPQSLSSDQVYAVTAFVLHLNGLLPADATLDADSLRRVRMPNRDGFRPVAGQR